MSPQPSFPPPRALADSTDNHINRNALTSYGSTSQSMLPVLFKLPFGFWITFFFLSASVHAFTGNQPRRYDEDFLEPYIDTSLFTYLTPLATTMSNDSASTLYRPLQPTLDVDKYPVAPDNLKLEQVHVYVRHGGFV